MIRAIIIDDEQHSSDRLAHLLANHCKHSILLEGVFQTEADSLRAIQALKPALVFLDIQIHDKTGFDLLQALPSIDFEVIFTTAYEKYAIQAFKFSAVDYLLKPVDKEELIQAVYRLEKRLADRKVTHRLETLLSNLKTFDPITKKIALPTSGGFMFVTVSEIIRCQSHINYTTLFLTGNRKITVAKTLKEFEQLLSEYNFFRVHNSHLINLSYMLHYKKGKGGMVIMADKSEIEVSIRRKEEFFRKLSG